MDPEPTTSSAIIQAGSRRRAMDWSLVLASQGIDHTITWVGNGSGWVLVLAPESERSAREAIRLYRLENRRWPWRREVLQTGFVFDWASLLWVFLVVFFYWFDAQKVDLRTIGAMSSTAVSKGEFWRLFTAVWLHGDLGHLASNLSIGFVLLGLACGRCGTGLGLLLSLLGGAGGNAFAGLLSRGPHQSLGASGLVMASLGLLAVQSVASWKTLRPGAGGILAGLAGGVLLFTLLGLTPGTDILAHLGGFICGILLGGILAGFHRASRNSVINAFAAVGFLFLVFWPWWLAIRHTGPG